jgi:hypothetical protein
MGEGESQTVGSATGGAGQIPAPVGSGSELARLVSRTGGQPPASELAELGERYDSIFTSLPARGRVRLHTEGAGAEGRAGLPASPP